MNSKSKNRGNSKTPNKKSSLSTVSTINNQSKFESIIVNIIAFLTMFAFGYIAIMSFIQTSVFDVSKYSSEVVLYQTDNIILNIAFTALFVFLLFKLKRYFNFFAKVNMKYMEIAIVAFPIIIGLIWILSVTSVPGADSYSLFEAATRAAKGDYSAMQNGTDFYNKDFYKGYSYFNYYPFQLGFVLFSEIIYRIFGTTSSMPIQVINVLCVGIAYLGIAKITKYLFKRRSIEFIAILLLAGFIQPVLLCTFVYGNIIGMCCAVWASFFLIRYFQTSKYTTLIPSGLLLIFAVLVKYNNMIYVIAFAIILVVHTIKAKKWQSIAFALAICIASLGSIQLVIMSYESRANNEFSNGVSQVLYLDLGLSDSYMAPGWYTTIAKDTYANNSFNDKAANAQAWNDINQKLKKFGNNASYTIDFFGKKILSQWNEPTFESIWISKVKQHTTDINAIGKSVYDGSLGQLFELHFNFYIQILYSLFAIGLCLLIIRKSTNLCTILLPLVILGGFGYHLLFEGKSQYVSTYIPLMIPTAAYAMNSILEGKYTTLHKYIDKLKQIPENKQA